MDTTIHTQDFDCTPIEEPCEQFGTNYNKVRAKAEANQFIRMINAKFPPPKGCFLSIGENLHDLGLHDVGIYHSVRANWPADDKDGLDWMLKIDAEPIEFWDDEARKALNIPEKQG